MMSYTIDITPSDSTQASATLTIHIDSQEWRVGEVSVRLGSSKSPFPGNLATLDFRSILETIVLLSCARLPGRLFSAPTETGITADGVESSIAESHRPESDGQSCALNPISSEEAQQQKLTLAHQAAMPNKATNKIGRTVKAQAQREDMPSDLAVVYWREGTIAKVANYYSVPRHIAQRWIKLLRQAGGAPNPWRPGRREGATENRA